MEERSDTADNPTSRNIGDNPTLRDTRDNPVSRDAADNPASRDIGDRTTNRAKDDGNMQILNFHMFHIGLLPGVFQNILWAREESFKIYSGHPRSLSKYTLGTS